MLEPAGSFAVVYLTAPAFSANFARSVVPLSNWMSPVGTTADDDTVTAKLTACPERAGFSDETIPMLVVAFVTLCVSAAAVLPIKLLSPVYTALIEWVPAASVLVVRVARLLLTAATLKIFEPSLNVIEPDA